MGTFAILPLAYFIRNVPLVTRAALASFERAIHAGDPEDVVEVADLAGVGVLQAAFQRELTQAWPELAVLEIHGDALKFRLPPQLEANDRVAAK